MLRHPQIDQLNLRLKWLVGKFLSWIFVIVEQRNTAVCICLRLYLRATLSIGRIEWSGRTLARHGLGKVVRVLHNLLLDVLLLLVPFVVDVPNLRALVLLEVLDKLTRTSEVRRTTWTEDVLVGWMVL